MTSQFTHGYALLIGVDKSEEARWDLPDVGKDVSALQTVLIHPERCAYLPENVKVVQGEGATRAGILDGLAWLRQKLAEDRSDNETAIVYFTGHGLRDVSSGDPVFYLRPHDARQESLRLSALRADDFAAEVQALNPKRLLVVLDCCHSGGIGAKGELAGSEGLDSIAIPPALFSMGAKDAARDDANSGPEGLAQGSGRAVLSSSQAGQLSWLRKDRTMSIFTYHLIEALTGHAQPQAGASEVLVSDVMSHVWRKVPESARGDWNKPQEPDYQVSGNFPVALLLGGIAWQDDQVAPNPLSTVIAKVTDLAAELSQTRSELMETTAREKALRQEVATNKYWESLKEANESWEEERRRYGMTINDESPEPSVRQAIGCAIVGGIIGGGVLGVVGLLVNDSRPDYYGSAELGSLPPSLSALSGSVGRSGVPDSSGPSLWLFVFVGIVLGIGYALYVNNKHRAFRDAERAHRSYVDSLSFDAFASQHFGLDVEHGSVGSWDASTDDDSSSHDVESRNPAW